MKYKFANSFNTVFVLMLIALLTFPFAAFAAEVDVSVADVLAPDGSITLAPGESRSMTINLSVTGSQGGEAEFQVYRDWTLSGGSFTGSNPQTFKVPTRKGGDPASKFSLQGSVSVAAGQSAGGPFKLVVGVFNIKNSQTPHLVARNTASYDVTVSATRLPTTTTVNCPMSVPYTGAAEAPCTATVTGAGGLSELLTVNYSNNTAVGTATASASFAGNSTYAASSSSKTFTIAKAPSTVAVNCSNVTYTGAARTPCTAAVTGAGGLDQPLTVTYSNNTAAGTATASASYAGDSSHEGNAGSTTFTIAKAASTTAVSCPGSVAYAGSAQTPCTASYSVVGGLSGTLTPTYANNTNAGTATASASYAGDANHISSNDSATFTIAKAASVTDITCPTDSVPYTGSQIEPCSATATGAGGLSETLVVSYSDNTNAGTASASASYAGGANHANSSKSVTFQIGSVGSTTTIECPQNVTYNGSAQTPCTARVTGAGGLNQSVAVIYTNNTNAGTATATATFAGDANHDGSSAATTFTIAKANATINVVGYSGTYDRAAHSAAGSATGIGGENPGTLSLGASFINVPGGTARWTFTGNGNYNDASGDVAIVISKANATIDVSGYTGTYDGAAHGATGSATGIGGEDPGKLNLGAGFTNVPGGTAGWTFTGNGNYNDANGDVTIVIGKAASTTIITCPANVTYSGLAQEPCTTTVTGAGGLNASAAVSYSNNTNAGTASATAAYAADTNHFGSADTASFTIDQAPSKVILACPERVTYTGSAQTPCSAKATGAGGLDAQVSVIYSANTNAGVASAVASYPGDTNHTGNIDSTTFNIAKASSMVTVTCAAGPFTYNGSAHAPCTATVTGAGGLSQPLTVSYHNNINASTATATATANASFAGDDNHTDSSGSKAFTIAKKTATVTPNAASKFYGDPDPAFSGTLTGFLPADNVAATYSRNSGETVGSYTISGALTPAGALDNYDITYNTAPFMIGSWTFSGFYQPVDMSTSSTVYNTVKSGSTVPIKFEVFKGSTELVSTVAVQTPLRAAQISCKTSAVVDAIELVTTGATVLRYDTTGGQFIYNWQTPSGKAGTCYSVTISSNDGSSKTAYFQLK